MALPRQLPTFDKGHPLMTSRYCRKHPSYPTCPPVTTNQDEVVIMALEDFVQAVKEATQTTLNVHNAMGQASRGAVDLGGLPGILMDLKSGNELLKELGYAGRYYLKFKDGKAYVVFKGYAGLRPTLNGTQYLAKNPKVINFGLGHLGAIDALKTNATILIVCYTTLDIANFILSDDQLYSELFANLIVDIGIGAASLIASTAVALGAAVLFGSVMTVAVPAAFLVGGALLVGMYVSYQLTEVEKAYNIKQNLAAALASTADAVSLGIQSMNEIIVDAHVSLSQKIDQAEKSFNRGVKKFEDSFLYHVAPGYFNKY
jgi:hypothetical protein